MSFRKGLSRSSNYDNSSSDTEDASPEDRASAARRDSDGFSCGGAKLKPCLVSKLDDEEGDRPDSTAAARINTTSNMDVCGTKETAEPILNRMSSPHFEDLEEISFPRDDDGSPGPSSVHRDSPLPLGPSPGAAAKGLSAPRMSAVPGAQSGRKRRKRNCGMTDAAIQRELDEVSRQLEEIANADPDGHDHFALCLVPHFKEVPKERRGDMQIAVLKAIEKFK